MSPRIESRDKILEQKVTLLLQKHAIGLYSKEEIAPHVAKVSLMKNHLYEDLGMSNRFEMGVFMRKNFPSLAEIKPKNKLWKEFIYDSISEVVPACATCNDQVNSFDCIA